MIKIILGTFAYFIPLMPYAYFWHMVCFKKQYTKWQYFSENDANVPLGFSSMVMQGIVLSVSYWILIQNEIKINPFIYVLAIGIYHWTVHVVAAMAKQSATRTWGYFWLESVFLIGQFGVFAILLNLVY